MEVKYKDPQDKVRYFIDWSAFLDTDTIATAVWTSPAALTRSAETNTATRTYARFSGGTVGEEYVVTCHMVSAGGDEKDYSFIIAIREA
jgi:hypothetical protein